MCGGQSVFTGVDCTNAFRTQEVADVQIEEDRFDVYYYLDFCANCREETEENKAEENRPAENHQNRLSDLLTTHWENVHLLYEDMDAVPHTIVELDSNTLTAEGKEAWVDVPGAQVVRVYHGFYGLQVELTGVRGVESRHSRNAWRLLQRGRVRGVGQ